MKAETDGLFVEPSGDVFREELIDRGLREAKEVVDGQHGLNEVVHLLRSGLRIGSDRQFAVLERHAEPLRDFLQKRPARGGLKADA